MSQNSDCTCCNDQYQQVAANTGVHLVSLPNTALDGSGNVMAIITGVANGTIIKSVTIKAIMPVTVGMVRLFISDAALPHLITHYTRRYPFLIALLSPLLLRQRQFCRHLKWFWLVA